MTIYIQQLMKQLEDICDRFHALVYVEGDAAAAGELLDARAELRNMPMGAGVAGAGEVGRYLARDLVPNRPADLRFERLARTGDRWRVADEYRVTFTHDRELPWLLPGVDPTGRSVEVPAMTMVQIGKSLIVSHRTLWDLHGVTTQLGLSGVLTSSTAG